MAVRKSVWPVSVFCISGAMAGGSWPVMKSSSLTVKICGMCCAHCATLSFQA